MRTRALGLVLGFGAAAGLALALLLAGRGAWLLGDPGGARALACGLLALGGALSFAGDRSLRAALGAGERGRGAQESRPSGRRPMEPRPEELAPRWLRRLCAGLLLLWIAALIAQFLRAPDGGWDAFSIWNARARQLLRTAGDVRAACDGARGLALFTLHPDYPLLLPALLAAGFRALGSRDGAGPLWLPALISGASWLAAIAIASRLAARASARRGLWVACALLTTPALAIDAGAQYAEGPLVALTCAGLALLTLAWERGDSRGGESPHGVPGARGSLFALAGLALGLSVSVKHEGMLALGAAALVLLLEDDSREVSRTFRRLLFFALGAAPPLALAAWFALRYAPPGDLAPNGVRAVFALRAAQVALHRLGPVLLALARRALFFQQWAAHLVAFALLLGALRWRGPLPARARRLLLWCALMLAGFVLAFLTTPHELQWHLRTSIDRLLLQLWPVALAALALAGPEPGLAVAQRDPASANETSSAGVVSR